MQWNVDLTAPPLKSATQQSNIQQECDPGNIENTFEDDLKTKDFGCTKSANVIAKQVTFLPGSPKKKFLLQMELVDMLQSFANDQVYFFSKFGPALAKLGSVGYAIEGQVEDKQSNFTRLGMLKKVDMSTCYL